MPIVQNPEHADAQAAKLGLTAQELGELIKPLWLLLYKHHRSVLTLTCEGTLGKVEIR